MCLIAGIATSTGPLHAQQSSSASSIQTASVSVEDAKALAEGWARLAKGDTAGAGAMAQAVLARSARSLPAFTLAVEAALAVSAAAALDRYESWLGSRTLEEPTLLRSVARAFLVEMARNSQNPTAQQLALKALAEAGEPAALDQVREAAYAGGTREARSLAALGDEPAVQILIADLTAGAGNKLPTMLALGASGRASAIPPLSKFLSDPEPVLRGYAADALGAIGNARAIPALQPALKDPIAYVRVRAAAALYRLGDSSGLPLLRDLAVSDSPKGRLDAAEALAVRPDAGWQALVRGLLKEPDPDTRLSAARLLIPHDPETARSVLQELSGDENPAIRTEVGRLAAAELPAGLADLRALLRDGDRYVRLAAAERVLTLTR
jgi:HEAT repeat protein